MPHLIIIRHTNTKPTPHRENKAWEVTAEGLARAERLARQLAVYQVEALYTSTFDKTKITGQILSDAWGLPICGALHAFDENDRQGVPFYASRVTFEAAIEQFFVHHSQVVFGRESADQVAERFARGIEQVTSDSAEKTIAVVTHGVAPASFLAARMGKTPFTAWQQTQQLGMPCFFVLTLPDLQFVKSAGLAH